MNGKEAKKLLKGISDLRFYSVYIDKQLAEDFSIDLAGYIERLEDENAKLKKDAANIRVEAIKEAATMCCPVSGYVVRDEQARKELMEYATFLEKTEIE